MFLFISMGLNAYLYYRWSQETDKKRFLLYKIAYEENSFFSDSNWKKKFEYIFSFKDNWPNWYTDELKDIKKQIKQ